MALELADELAKAGFSVSAKDHAGTPTHTFVVRGAPGNIPSASSSKQEPSHFELAAFGKTFELHIGVNHEGISKTTHELDLSIVAWASAQACRQTPSGGPYRGQRLLAIELKAYDADKFLDKEIARALVGRAIDLDPSLALPFMLLYTGGGYRIYGPYGQQRIHWLITSAKVRPGTVEFLGRYSVRVGENISPANCKPVISDLVATFQNGL